MNSAELQEQGTVEQKIDYFKILKIFWSRWYWVAGCLLVSMSVAYAYLWYTAPVYATSGSLKFDEKQSEFSQLLSGVSSGNRTSRLVSEGYVIQSRDVLMNAIGRLDYKISFYLKGRVRTSEVYPNKPFDIEILTQDTLNFYRGLMEIKQMANGQFRLGYKTGEKLTENIYHFNDIINMPGISFRIKSSSAAIGAPYSFKFNAKEDFLGRAGTVSMGEASKGSNIMQLSLVDKNPVFAADMLNAIMKEYTEYDVKLRSASATQTIQFIERQLDFLNQKVQKSSGAITDYRKKNTIVDVGTSTSISLGKYNANEAQRQQLELQDLSLKHVEDQIKNNSPQVMLVNIEGPAEGSLGTLTSQLNGLLKQREDKLALGLLPGSPTVQRLESDITDLKAALLKNIKLTRSRFQETVNIINSRLAEAKGELANVPEAERQFANLQSEFDINQKVYTYLSEKRLEAQISRAAVVPGATVVNYANGAYPISPNSRKTYSNALLAGLAAGIGLILLARLVNPYIYDKETVENYTRTPIIGIIRKFPAFIDQDNRQALSLQKPKSIFAESVRSVRTNISFLAAEKNSKLICVTSEISGEGKSFVSVNLASTLALIEKKVVLIGADLRRSKLHRTFQQDNKTGLSSYLSNQTELDTLIHKTNLEYLDFIPSGPIPPNPSELLHSKKMLALMEELKTRYDYVLLDTAPVGLVSDSIPLVRNSDINLFVLRAGTSKITAASVPDRISREYHLSNVVIVLNAFEEDALHSRYYTSNYGGSYGQYYYSDYTGYTGNGYYDDEDKPKWWEFWKKGSSTGG